ncbi:unnamed protein product [Parajaminaea phylloscopi]
MSPSTISGDPAKAMANGKGGGPTSSSVMSPNHPTNLRRQAKAVLDPSFSVRSYLGAAAALLEKAESSDRQGHLEQAFVNYLKAGNVANFITKHPEWPEVQAQRGPTFFRYQDLMQRITDVISRATRIEATLKEREEHRASVQEQQRASSSSLQSSGTQSITAAIPPPPAEPGPAKQLRSSSVEQGGAAAALAEATILPPPDQQADEYASGSGSATPVLADRKAGGDRNEDQVSSLADRLAALRSGSKGGLGGVAMGKRMSEPVVPSRPPQMAGDGPDGVSRTPSQFAQSYPTLDDFDRENPSPLPTAPSNDLMPADDASGGMFPSTPLHAPGGSGDSARRRPLPDPPAPPNDLALGRDVPMPFSLTSQSTSGRDSFSALPPSSSASTLPSTLSSPTKAPPSSVARPSSLVPGSPRSASAPKSKTPLASNGSAPPVTLPRGNHIKVEELWQVLNPGFERVSVNGERDGANNDTRIVRKRGLRILLLDLRTRDEFDAGKIVAGSSGEVVCLDGGVFLRRGMTSVDLEDKLLLAPTAEQTAFANRHKFDGIVLYDQSSRLLGQPSPSNPALSGWASFEEAAKAYEKLDIVVKAIYEHEFVKPLRASPLLLVGGWDSWSKKVGSRAIVAGNGASGTGPQGRKVQANGSPEIDRRMQEEEMLKRQRRQGFVMPGTLDAGTGSPSWSPSAYTAPSMPAKVYQSPAASISAPPNGAPAFPPTATISGSRTSSDAYFPSQPSIPYGETAHSHVALPRHNGTSGFDYPSLRPLAASSPKIPPAVMNSNGVSTRSMTSQAVASDAAPSAPRPSGALSAGGSRMNVRMLPSFDDLRIGLTGLKNVGNSCYQNATLQCLSATIPLAKFMLDGSYKRDINPVNPLGTQGALAESFAHLVKVMWSEQYTFVSPVTFREAISRFAQVFRGYDQHDSQEFLSFLLDGLHEDLNRVIHKPPPVEMTAQREKELETLPQQVASVKEWTIYRQRNDSLIVDWFQGQFRNKMTCLTCGMTSTTYNAFMYLSLPIPQGRGFSKVSLFQCLDAFVKEEVMDKADAWNCPNCKKPRKATKRLSISRLPMILLIHLKRFSFKGPFTDKIESQVTFPTEGLDLTNYVPAPLPPALAKSYSSGGGGGSANGTGVPISRSQIPPYVYDLYAVTYHHGSLNTGHYTAGVRNAGGEWWYCDDSRTSSCSSAVEKQMNSSSPYVLFFRRRP